MLLILFSVLILMFIIGVPIAVSLGTAVIVTFIFSGDFPLFMVTQRLYANLTHYSLMAVPFFILAGKIMERGGIARRLIDFANTLVGRFPGGLALTGILACMFFASISGSSTATVAAIGSIIIPGMLERGYGKNFGHGTGHGIGFFVHVGPRLSTVSEDRLKVNNIITVEPGIYISGWGGVRIEDDVLITRTGNRVLNKAPKKLLEL